VSSVDLHVAPRVEPQRKQTEKEDTYLSCVVKKKNFERIFHITVHH
jgi:hypothetical protein